MMIMNKKLVNIQLTFQRLCVGLMLLASCSLSSAEETYFEDLSLNGLSTYVQLRDDYYIGGLYLETLNSDAEDIIYSAGAKRMELRVLIDKWSPRRFAQQWNQLLLINNNADSINNFSDEILSFLDLPKDDLIAGDKITIDLDPANGTSVYLNGVKAFQVKDNEFFNLLLNTWIGPRPPSSGFKNNLLTLSTDTANTELLTRYESSEPSEERSAKVAKWFAIESKKTKKEPSEDRQSRDEDTQVAGIAPPSTDTTKAKRLGDNTTSIEKPELKIALETVSTLNKPVLELEKPAFTSASTSIATGVAGSAPVGSTNTTQKADGAPAENKTETEDVKSEQSPPEQDNGENNAQNEMFAAYQKMIVGLTFKNTEYPDRAYEFKQQGKVIIKVVINREGKVLDIIEESLSKYGQLNRAAVKAVKKTSPYPKLPSNLIAKEITVTLPFTFKI